MESSVHLRHMLGSRSRNAGPEGRARKGFHGPVRFARAALDRQTVLLSLKASWGDRATLDTLLLISDTFHRQKIPFSSLDLSYCSLTNIPRVPALCQPPRALSVLSPSILNQPSKGSAINIRL